MVSCLVSRNGRLLPMRVNPFLMVSLAGVIVQRPTSSRKSFNDCFLAMSQVTPALGSASSWGLSSSLCRSAKRTPLRTGTLPLEMNSMRQGGVPGPNRVVYLATLYRPHLMAIGWKCSRHCVAYACTGSQRHDGSWCFVESRRTRLMVYVLLVSQYPHQVSIAPSPRGRS